MIRHRQRLAKPTINGLILDRVDSRTENDALLAHIVAESILTRLDHRLVEAKNIYVEDFKIPQIVMFYKMAQAYPHIFESHAIANQHLLRAAEGLDWIAAFDIGIGKGRQMVELLDALARRPDPPRRVDVIALDPVTSNLEEAGAAVRDAAARAGFEFAYHPIHGMLESLGDDELARVAELAPGRLLINAAYTMHHTRHAVGDTEQRTRLLRRLAALEPRVLTLIEPNANHDTENIARRFHHAWNHFGAVFELIDESALDANSRFAIKEKFFGREIRDLFGVSDSFRCERHEPYESWLLRLARAGFEPAPRVELRVELPAHSSLDIADGLVRLDYRGETLIAVFAYRPSAGGSER